LLAVVVAVQGEEDPCNNQVYSEDQTAPNNPKATLLVHASKSFMPLFPFFLLLLLDLRGSLPEVLYELSFRSDVFRSQFGPIVAADL